MLSTLGWGFLIAGYVIVAAFIVIERSLRQSGSAKTLERGDFDRGSTLLIGLAFGFALIVPIFADIVLGAGLFQINLVEGIVALAVMLLGLGIRIWAAKTLGKYYTRTLLTTEHQKVITSGPYSAIRHPGYLGDWMLWSGFGVLTSNVALIVIYPIMFLIIYVYRIRVEEKMLLATLGEEYSEYRKKTRKLFPHLY
jgi:protein-S-isoprenylcysteine O-methyltransferase Ste14